MIRRKLTHIELQLDDTKELDELLSRPVITQTNNFFNLAAHKIFQHPSLLEKQLQLEAAAAATNNNNNNNQETNRTTVVGSSTTITTTTTTTITEGGTETQERLGYNPQPYNSSSRFQFNQSGIR